LDQRAWAEDLLAQGKRAVRVTYPRTANNEKELTVVRGELLEVLDDSRKWWKTRNQQGLVGHVPHTIVNPYEPASYRGSSPPHKGRRAEYRHY
jgi:epidermal growth factor receptor kinase substrate 8